MNKKTLIIPIGELFNFFGLENCKENEFIPIGRFLAIKNPKGEFSKINSLIKKKGNIFQYDLEDNINITCDENHLVKDKNNNFNFIKNLEFIQTIYGLKKIINSKLISENDNVYDISIDSPHEYITNSGIICHNTTAAKILTHHIDCDVLYINASEKGGADFIREEIIPFVSSMSFNGLKIVILDEVDASSQQFQAILRPVMETYSKHSRFILTCNYKEKVIEPVKSRCQQFSILPPSDQDVIKRLKTILDKEKVIYEISDIKKIVDDNFPDIRQCINELQRCVNSNNVLKLLSDSGGNLPYFDMILKELKSKDKKKAFLNIRQIVSDSKIKSFEKFYRFLFDKIDEYSPNDITNIMLIIARYQYESQFVIDKEISAMAMLVEILNDLK